MSLKLKIIVSIVILLTVFAAGRYSAPSKVVVQTHEVIREVKVEQKSTDADTDAHTQTVTTQIKRPDGTVETTTQTTQDSHTQDKTTDKVVDKSSGVLDSTKTTIYGNSKVTINGAIKVSLTNPFAPPAYGVSISRPILGPATLGAFVFSDKQVGFSLGLTF